VRCHLGLERQCMRMFSEVVRQKIWRLINGHVINSTLHWAEEMVIKMRNVDGLIHH
jgi:hypothetical protein